MRFMITSRLDRPATSHLDMTFSILQRGAFPIALFAVLACLTVLGPSVATALANTTELDQDRDGLPDSLEEELLERFHPTFMISQQECDGKPAEFRAGVAEPRVVAKNGTIYGQVMPKEIPGLVEPFVEIHYYHLWSRDCGRGPHALDAEHVSALVRGSSKGAPASEWTAVFWYAAAHEDTVCDASNGARASFLGAEENGAIVWISRGKHASYLSRDLCRLGCGSDRCGKMTVLPTARVIHIGEPEALLNGAVWAESARWPFIEKMSTDFDAHVLGRLDSSHEETPEGVVVSIPPTKAIILSGNSALTALTVSNKESGNALLKAGGHSAGAVGTALKKSGKGVFRALGATGRALGIRDRTPR